MTTLSPQRSLWPILDEIPLLGRGKVRDSYPLGERHLLSVVTDGISIYDFVLNALIPGKGYVLTALSHFWFLELERLRLPTHMVAIGPQIDEYLPPRLQGDKDRWRRAMVVHRLDMLKDAETGRVIEWILRFCLTGGALKEYRARGTVAGISLKPGLQDGDELPFPILDPTTKEPSGHDRPLDAQSIRRQHPEAAAMFERGITAIANHLRSLGIRAADFKGEMGRDSAGVIRFADEIGTPDCSRFWLESEWARSRLLATRSAPSAYDKELVRTWGKTQGFDTLDPDDPVHVAKVHAVEVPPEVIVETRRRYLAIADRILGMPLEEYWWLHMGIPS